MPSSRHVRMTRTAISPRLAIRTLRNNGVPSRRPGNRSPYPTAVPDPGRTSNGPQRFGDVRRFAEIDSTNRYLLDEARARRAGRAGGGRRRADRRAGAGSAGAGRRRRARRCWCRCCCARRSRAERSRLVTMAAGARRWPTRSRRSAGVDAGLKWPNDLVVGDRKLAGILAEARRRRRSWSAPGCNVDWDAFPAELAATATACNLEAGRRVDRDALLDAFLDALRRPRSTTLDDGASTTTGRGSRRSAGGCGSSTCAATTLVGDAVDVTDDGALVVRDDDGTDRDRHRRRRRPPPLTGDHADARRCRASGVEVAGDEGGEGARRAAR